MTGADSPFRVAALRPGKAQAYDTPGAALVRRPEADPGPGGLTFC